MSDWSVNQSSVDRSVVVTARSSMLMAWVGHARTRAIAAIALGSSVVVRQRRQRRWQAYDTAEIRRRLQERFAGIDDVHA
jgi:hypothetical protein